MFFVFLTSTVLILSSFGRSTSTTYLYQYPTHVYEMRQWTANNGYCGEVSFIQACMKIGGCYYSQYDVRKLGTLLTNDRKQRDGQYLVGDSSVSAANTANKLLLKYEMYPRVTTSPKDYLVWVKNATRYGKVVTMCLFLNKNIFEADTVDNEYDHIVSVVEIKSNFDDSLYHGADVLVIDDHGLYTPNGDDNSPVYEIEYTFDEWIATRAAANTNNHPYSVPDNSVIGTGNWGIAHTGLRAYEGDVVGTGSEYNDDTSICHNVIIVPSRADERYKSKKMK